MQGRAPHPAGPRPRSSTAAGSTGLTPPYIQSEGQGLPACGRSRNQSTCVPLPCHRESGQKAQSQVGGMHRGVGGSPSPGRGRSSVLSLHWADPDEAAPASPPFPRRGSHSTSGIKAPALQSLWLPRKESPAPQAAQQHQSLQQLLPTERVGLDSTGALSLP